MSKYNQNHVKYFFKPCFQAMIHLKTGFFCIFLMFLILKQHWVCKILLRGPGGVVFRVRPLILQDFCSYYIQQHFKQILYCLRNIKTTNNELIMLALQYKDIITVQLFSSYLDIQAGKSIFLKRSDILKKKKNANNVVQLLIKLSFLLNRRTV